MRAITHGDVSAAARSVLGLPAAAQQQVVHRLLDRAHAADRFRKRFGRAHPFWGNGSLMAVALAAGGGREEPSGTDTRHLEAMAAVIEAILDWRRRAP